MPPHSRLSAPSGSTFAAMTSRTIWWLSQQVDDAGFVQAEVRDGRFARGPGRFHPQDAAFGHRLQALGLTSSGVGEQLQFLLEVETVDYKRLEVGSPGIDRPLRNERDFERFAGQVVDITLKAPIGATGSSVAANRKKFRGTLERAAEGGGWQLVWSDEPVLKPGQRVGKNRPPAPVHALGFVLDELREARLAPIVSFKGRAAPHHRVVPEQGLWPGSQITRWHAVWCGLKKKRQIGKVAVT